MIQSSFQRFKPSPGMLVFLAFFVLQAGAFPDSTLAQNASEDQLARGKKIYTQTCWACHQANGQGLPGVFPPLAGSDYFKDDAHRNIRNLILGLNERITVNGKNYAGMMPPSGLSDEQIADVLTYVGVTWGNSSPALDVSTVASVRKKLGGRASAMGKPYPDLPVPPEGGTLREVVRMPENPVRLLRAASGNDLYVLAGNANLYRLEPVSGQLHQVLWGDKFIDGKRGDANCVGFCRDSRNRYYFVVNQQNVSGSIATNEVTIFRTTSVNEKGDPENPIPWFKAAYPWGVGPYNHGVGNAAIGPDGMLYVGSGSRTDGNEKGFNSRYSTMGEHPLTSCMWQLDPKSDKPELKIFARGLRNNFGFCWDAEKRLVATENGPDADAPEELNVLQEGKHYGFPYQFSDWSKKAYSYTPDAPPGLVFTLPVANLGPAAGGSREKPLYTFEPHSSPAGIALLGEDFPAPYRGGLLVTRFGNLLKKPKDSGFDLLLVHLHPSGEHFQAEISTLLAPLSRPIDVTVGGGGTIYIAEYGRATSFEAAGGMLPGRILELTLKK
jgi:mono/diheme cytochrome c family protein